MPTTLNIFISSKMVELKQERDAIFELIPTLDYGEIKLHAWVFEEDAGAAGKPIREVYLDALKKSALYLGLFWNQYGEYTIDEFDRATEWGIVQHIYVKDVEADKRDSRLVDFLNKHGDVKKGITAKWFKTTDELCAAVKRSIEQWISDRLLYRSGASSAIFAKRADHLREKPRVFIGRENLINQVYPLLEGHQQVLLQGFGGMGKTALASALAAKWIADGKGNVLWLKAGNAEADALFEALARPFDKHQAIASQTGEAKITAVNDLLHDCGASLLVLDDCWNSRALFTLLEAVPSDMSALMTARQRYPIEGEIIPVEKLSDDDSLALLTQHAGSVGTQRAASAADGDNLDLCHLLGNHAFAVEIAGKTLKAHNWTPTELIAQIKDAPDKLTMPLELAETGRENVAKLLEVSLNALDEPARNVFLAFGAFFAPQLTAEMLQIYFDEASNSPFHEGEGLGVKVVNALDTLHLNGLVERLPATETSITAYRVHDLAYSYARSQATDDEHQQALQACLSYVGRYNRPSLPDFSALRPALDNLLSAADWAFANKRYAAVEQFAWNLYTDSAILDYGGFYSEATRLLMQAAESALYRGNRRNQGAHLGNLGINYSALGQIQKAIEYYEKALTISRQISDMRNEGSQLGNLGNAYSDLGQMEKAIEYHEQALTISRQIGDKRAEGNRLGNLGIVYSNLRQVEKAIEYYEQALTISRQIGDRGNEGSQLGNLGIAYGDMGQMEKAIEYHEQALTISRQIGDKHNEGSQLGNLGIAYGVLRQVEKAIDYHTQAIKIRRSIGDLMGEAHDLNNMGVLYEYNLNDYPRALQYYQQARALYVDIGAQHLVENTDDNIRMVNNKLNGKDAPSSETENDDTTIQIFAELAKLYHEHGEDVLREILKEANTEDTKIEQVITMIKGIDNDTLKES